MSSCVSGMILPGCSFPKFVTQKVPVDQPNLGPHMQDGVNPVDRYLSESATQLSTEAGANWFKLGVVTRVGGDQRTRIRP